MPLEATTVQAQRVSVAQVLASAWLAHGSTVAHTAAGQSALAGQPTAVQAQAAPPLLQASAVVNAAHGSDTTAAASCSGAAFWVGLRGDV